MLKITRHCKIRLMGSMDGISLNKKYNHIQKAHRNVRKKLRCRIAVFVVKNTNLSYS
jgi:hypothetical protein